MNKLLCITSSCAKFLCVKLLMCMSLNVLVVPFANAGKSFKQCRKVRKYNKKVARKRSRKEKARERKHQEFLEKLSQENKYNNKLLQDKLRQKRIDFKNRKNIKRNKKLEQNIRVDVAPRFRGIKLSKMFLPFLILGFFAQLASAEDVMCNEDNFRFRLLRGQILLKDDFVFCTLCEDNTGNIDPIEIDLSDNPIECRDTSYNLEIFDYEWRYGLRHTNKIDLLTSCECKFGNVLHCNNGYFDLNNVLVSNILREPTALDVASEIASVATSVFIGSGCIIVSLGALGLYACKKIKKMRQESKKELDESNSVLLKGVMAKIEKVDGKDSEDCRLIKKYINEESSSESDIEDLSITESSTDLTDDSSSRIESDIDGESSSIASDSN